MMVKRHKANERPGECEQGRKGWSSLTAVVRSKDTWGYCCLHLILVRKHLKTHTDFGSYHPRDWPLKRGMGGLEIDAARVVGGSGPRTLLRVRLPNIQPMTGLAQQSIKQMLSRDEAKRAMPF